MKPSVGTINSTVGRNSRSLESRACVLTELGVRRDPAGFKKRVRYSSRQPRPEFKCVRAPPSFIRGLTTRLLTFRLFMRSGNDRHVYRNIDQNLILSRNNQLSCDPH